MNGKQILNFIGSSFLFVLIALWLLLPSLTSVAAIRVLVVGMFVFFLMKYNRYGSKKILYLFLFYFVYTSSINYFFSDSVYVVRHLQLYIFLFVTYTASVLLYFPASHKIRLVYIILCLNIITGLITISELMVNSSAARVIAKTNEESIELTSQGVGGYAVVYFNVVCMPIFIMLKKVIKTKKFLILSNINLAVALVLIVMANYFIALLMTIFAMTYLFVYSKGDVRSKVIKTLLLILLLLAFWNFIPEIKSITYNWVDGTSLRYKHEDIFASLEGREQQYNTVTGRSERYMRSLKLFLTSPLVGVFSFNNVGKHSNILDQFAQYGVVLGIILINLLLLLPRKVLTYVDEDKKHYIYLFMALLIILGLLNNYAMAIGVAMILLVCAIQIKQENG